MTTMKENQGTYTWKEENTSQWTNRVIMMTLLTALAFFWAYRRPTHAALFVVGLVINGIVNHLLKMTIRAPRPNEDVRLFQMEKASGRPIETQRYGMPSHHAQMMLYMTVFLYLTFRNKWLLLISGLASLYVCFMRVKENKHTFWQVFVGAWVGGFIAAIVYYWGWMWISKKRETGIREDGFLLSKNYSFG